MTFIMCNHGLRPLRQENANLSIVITVIIILIEKSLYYHKVLEVLSGLRALKITKAVVR